MRLPAARLLVLAALGATVAPALVALAQEPPAGAPEDEAKRAADEAKLTPEERAKKAAEDEETKRIDEGLARQREFAEKLRRAQQLERELRELGSAAGDWVQSAVLLVELGDIQDRRAVPAIAARLTDPRPLVVAFALHGLARLGAEDLKKGGGEPLAAGLIEALEVRAAYHRRVARELLVRVAGEDLGPTPGKWKAWLKKNGAALAVEDPPPPWNEAAHDRVRVASRRDAQGGGGTMAPRIPPVATQLREMNKGGLDVAFALDQTGSMGAVIEEAKQRLELLTSLVGLIVADTRYALVTFDDGLKVNEALSPNVGRLRETLSNVHAAGGNDTPEGVDKALEACAGERMGWRRKAAKVIIIIGDAPPHDADIQRTLDTARALKARLEITTDTVSTGGSTEPTLAKIAEAGGGRALLLGEPARLVSEVLLLIFGEGLRPAMERFVPVLMEIQSEPAPAGR